MQYTGISIFPRAMLSGVMLIIYCIQTSGVVNNYYIYHTMHACETAASEVSLLLLEFTHTQIKIRVTVLYIQRLILELNRLI